MLEHHELRKQLQQRNQELATALYEHDAAVRVIARLAREQDQARQVIWELGNPPVRHAAILKDQMLPSASRHRACMKPLAAAWGILRTAQMIALGHHSL